MSNQLYKGFRPDEMEYQHNPDKRVPEYSLPSPVAFITK
jgi:hypothetical protein